MIDAARQRNFLDATKRSRLGWLMACFHAAWFFAAIANMSPPSPGFGAFLDNGGGSSATLLAGRPFHYTYESIFLKTLIVVDLPAMLAGVPVALIFDPVLHWLHIGHYSGSYVGAGMILLLASVQWLVIGGRVESWLSRNRAGKHFLQKLDRHFVPCVILTFVVAAIAVPVINTRSRVLGFRHGGISFH